MPKPNYHICLVTPEGAPGYALIFREIALLLIHSFNSIGLNCTLKANQLYSDKLNIILGYLNLHSKGIPEGLKYIPYQLEQLSRQEGWYIEHPKLKYLLKNAAMVWDYSLSNIDFLKQEKINAQYLPLGFHENLELIKAENKDIDVLFYGSLNERRKKIIDQLSQRGLTVKVLTYPGVFSAQRDQYIARAKIVLNIHCFNMKVFEAARISYLLNNKVLVISEQSTDNPYEKVELIQPPYEQLAEECVQRLADWENSQKIAELNYQQFKENYPMTGFLERVIL